MAYIGFEVVYWYVKYTGMEGIDRNRYRIEVYWHGKEEIGNKMAYEGHESKRVLSTYDMPARSERNICWNTALFSMPVCLRI